MSDYIKQLEARNEQMQERATQNENIFNTYKKNFEIEVSYTRGKNKKVDYVEVDVYIAPKSGIKQMLSSVGIMQITKKKNEWSVSFCNNQEAAKVTIPESTPEEYAATLIKELGFEHLPYTIKERKSD